MSFESLFTETSTLTARRKVYTQTVFDTMTRQGAKDLVNGLEKREVIVPAIAKIVAATVPNSGKGHAEKVAQMVNDQIDSIVETEETDAA